MSQFARFFCVPFYRVPMCRLWLFSLVCASSLTEKESRTLVSRAFGHCWREGSVLCVCVCMWADDERKCCNSDRERKGTPSLSFPLCLCACVSKSKPRFPQLVFLLKGRGRTSRLGICVCLCLLFVSGNTHPHGIRALSVNWHSANWLVPCVTARVSWWLSVGLKPWCRCWPLQKEVEVRRLMFSAQSIACWFERQTRDRKIASSNPGRSSGRICFSRVNFVFWLLYGVRFTLVLP